MKNIFVLGFFPDQNKAFLKTLCENFNIIMFKAQFASSFGDVKVQFVEDIVEVNKLQFPQTEFSWEIHHSVNQIEEQLGKLIPGNRTKVRLHEHEFTTLNNVAFPVYWQAFLFSQLMDRINIALLLVNADYSRFRRPMVIEAKNRGIPVLDIEHGFFAMEPEPKTLNANFLPSTPYISDFVNLDNDLEKVIWDEHYELSELKQHVTFVVNGTPNDISFDEKLKKEDALAALNLHPDKFTLSLIGSWIEARIPSYLLKAQIEQVEFYKFVFQGLKNFPRKNDIQVIVKLHPAFATEQVFEDSTNYLKHLARECGLEHVLLTCTGLSEVLSGSDMLIASNRSSVLWEAFLASIPAFIYPTESAVKYMFKKGNLNNCNVLFQKGAMKYVSTAEEFQNAVNFYLQQENLEGHKVLCEKLFDEFNIKPLSAKEKSEKICGWIRTFLKNSEDDAGTSKLRVLQIIHDFPPQSFSDTEFYTLNFSKELEKRGHDVTVLYPVHDSQKKSLQFEEAKLEGLKVVRFNSFQPGEKNSDILNNEFDAPFRAFLQKHDFDIVHVQHLFGLSANWVSIAKEAGLPVLMKLDDMYLYCRQGHLMYKSQSYCSGPDSLDKCYECTFGAKSSDDPEYIASIYYYLALRREVMQSMFRQVDFVHTPSRFLKDTCVANNLTNREFHVIPTGISPFEIQKRKKKRGVVRIGFMGKIDIRAGFDIFLEAIEQANSKMTAKKQASLQFKIYGRHFNNDLYHSMCAKVNDLQNATYLGSFSPAERPQIFSEIDLLVLPSLGENYPFILRESLYAGVPAVATAIAGVPEIIKDGENGFLIPPRDVEALTDIFVKIANSPACLKQLTPQQNNIKLIAREAEEFEEIYLKLIPNRAAAADNQEPIFQKIRELVSAKKYIDGLNLLAKIIDKNPQNPEALNLMGEIYERLGKTAEAVELQNMAKQLS